MAENIYTVKEVAEILKVSERQVWRYIESGKLKKISLSPKTIRVSEKDLQDFIKENK